MPPFRWSVVTQEVLLQVDQLVAVLLQHRQGCVQLPVDAPLDGIAHLADISLGLTTQFCQFICRVQPDAQEEQDFLVVELQVHDDFPQMRLDKLGVVTACDYVGIVSGNKESDKFNKAGFSAVKSEFVNAPIIEQLPMCLECELVSYDSETCFMVGRIVNIYRGYHVLPQAAPPG